MLLPLQQFNHHNEITYTERFHQGIFQFPSKLYPRIQSSYPCNEIPIRPSPFPLATFPRHHSINAERKSGELKQVAISYEWSLLVDLSLMCFIFNSRMLLNFACH